MDPEETIFDRYSICVSCLQKSTVTNYYHCSFCVKIRERINYTIRIPYSDVNWNNLCIDLSSNECPEELHNTNFKVTFICHVPGSGSIEYYITNLLNKRQCEELSLWTSKEFIYIDASMSSLEFNDGWKKWLSKYTYELLHNFFKNEHRNRINVPPYYLDKTAIPYYSDKSVKLKKD